MSANPPQTVSIKCPSCQTPYPAQVVSIVDIDHNPGLKQLLLQGRLNVTTCPNCGMSGMMTVPLVYHDASKEFLFCMVPQELNLNENERQRVIGEMSRAIMNALPSEQRKGYLLRPNIFLTFQSMVEAVLEGDGITKEMLQAQEDKIHLIQQLAPMVGDGMALSVAIGENQDMFDEEFFALLSASVQSTLQRGDSGTAERLNALMEKLLEATPTGQDIAQRQARLQKAVEGLDENTTPEDLIKRILSLDPEQEEDILGVLVSIARPLIDYPFFQMLTERIAQAEEAGDQDFAERGTRIRDKIFELTQQLDEQVRETMQARTGLLNDLLQSPNPKALISARLDQIDDVFMSVLAINLQESEQRNDEQAQQRLEAVRDAISQVLTAQAPPELQFIQRLLQADYPDQTRQILHDNPAMVNAQMVQTMRALAESMQEGEQKELGEKLGQIAAQAQLVVGLA